MQTHLRPELASPQTLSVANDLIQRLRTAIVPAALVGLGYFLVARLSLGLLLEPDGVAVFWPAAGISSGVLIALGPRARWPVVFGVMAATIAANLLGDRNLEASIAFAFCNAAEALITASFIHRYFGPSPHLGRLRDVLGLFAAAVVGSAISGVGGAASYKVFHSPDVSILTIWWHWFASDFVGIIAFAPPFIGIATSIRRPPVRGEIPEALAALGILTATTLLVILMPPQAWATVVPGALLLPSLLWLAARFRSVFSAIGGFIISVTVFWTAILGIGHFGTRDIPAADRILQAQAFIVVMIFGALLGAALFAERRRAENRLVRANMALERERDNKLMNAEAVAAAIAHEIRQPLSAIVLDATAGQKFLEKKPPDHQRAHEALSRIMAGAHHTSEVFDGVRSLFRRTDEVPRPSDVNEIVQGVLGLVLGELQDRGIAQRVQLAPELPLVPGNRNQLHEVILNLVQNALDAMDGAPRRVLRLTTELHGPDAIRVTVQDTGLGIDAEKLDRIFDAFFTTKKNGMGLGLAICRMIIERHGGRLFASSDGKAGAVFTIELPVRPLRGPFTSVVA